MNDAELEEGKTQLNHLEEATMTLAEANKEHLENLDRLEELNKVQQEGMEDEICRVHDELTNEINLTEEQQVKKNDVDRLAQDLKAMTKKYSAQQHMIEQIQEELEKSNNIIQKERNQNN